MIRWIPLLAATALLAFELLWLFSGDSAESASLSDALVAAAMFAAPIFLIALVLTLSRPPQTSYFMASGVVGVLVVVVLLCLTANDHFSAWTICLWLSVVAWVGVVPTAISFMKDRGRKA